MIDSKRDTVVAIVPAYNEGERIGVVIDVLTQTKLIDEIIVIDDASEDNTSEEVCRFSKVTLLKNEENQGKAESMQKGVDYTNASVIFFCDADLVGLTPEIVGEIIQPILEERVDMFIGVRNNVMQKSFTPFAINSGERALRREVWESLPRRFKHRYRIEAGLNYAVRNSKRGYDYKIFDYYQTLKEKKYGFFRGTILRWWMHFDVGFAYIMIAIDRLRVLIRSL